jgi:hypothetical protein
LPWCRPAPAAVTASDVGTVRARSGSDVFGSGPRSRRRLLAEKTRRSVASTRRSPKACRSEHGTRADDAQRDGDRAQPEPRAEDAGDRVGQKPARVGQGELRGEQRRAFVCGRRALDEAARRRLDESETDPEDQPESHKFQVGGADCHKRKRTGEKRPSRQLDRPVLSPTKQERGDCGRSGDRSGGRSSERGGNVRAAEIEVAADDHDGVDGRHRARGGGREVEGQESAESRDTRGEPGADRDQTPGAVGQGFLLTGGEAEPCDEDGGQQEGDPADGEQRFEVDE